METTKYMFMTVLLLFATTAGAQEDRYEQWGPTSKSGAGVIARVGYTIGGTTPLPLPNEIRSINAFSPHGGATIGADVYKMVSRRWGMSVGWHFFYEGFHTSADVKNYKMSLTQEGNTMSGYFTGCDVTNVGMWGMTMPLLATWRMSPRWNMSFGPYFTVFFKQSFDGGVYEGKDGVGYLRVDVPTGDRIAMERSDGASGYMATYDFSDHMRQWNGGVELAFDWKATRHLNVFAKLDWGLSDIFEPDFEAIDFHMYPIYGTLGVAYRY